LMQHDEEEPVENRVDVEKKVRIRFNLDHVTGNFEWATPPSCCEVLQRLFDDKAAFTSRFVDGNPDAPETLHSLVYLLPLTANGEVVSPDGVAISFCPFCGTKLHVRRKTT